MKSTQRKSPPMWPATKRHKITLATLIVVVSFKGSSMAFPPAPHHEIYGTVRDDKGNPISAEASVSIAGSEGTIVRGPVDQTIAPGVNYSLKVPMDAGTLEQLYRPTALRPSMPFTAEVVIGGTSFVPIEIQGGALQIGEPGERTRLDLTLGVDSDGDGLPDSWEQELIDVFDQFHDLADVNPTDDPDHDGVSNYDEYIAGTYAFDKRASLELEIVEMNGGIARLRFLAVTGRTYSLSVSSDLKEYSSLAFSLERDGSQERTSYLSNTISFRDIYVLTSHAKRQFYRLDVR